MVICLLLWRRKVLVLVRQYCKSTGICTAILIKNLYWYWQYFVKVLLTALHTPLILNNSTDIRSDVKHLSQPAQIKLILFTCCFLQISLTKTRPAQKLLVRVKFTGNPYSYGTRINVNRRHWNTRKLVFTGTWTQTRTRVYMNGP